MQCGSIVNDREAINEDNTPPSLLQGLMAGSQAWAPQGGAWRPAIVTGLGKNRKSSQSAFGSPEQHPHTDLYWRKSELKDRGQIAINAQRSTFMKKVKVGTARVPAKKAPATRKSSTKSTTERSPRSRATDGDP